MKKLSFLFLLFFVFVKIDAQVGINTKSPQGWFHVDPMNNTGGTVGAPTNDSDDVIVTNDGKVGIGTAYPSNKLSIVSTGTDTGLHLPNGAATGKVLTSDMNGNAVWVSSAEQYQTSVYGGSFSQVSVNSVFPNFIKITTFDSILLDNTATQFPGYGWDIAKQQYIVPIDGVYRVAMNVYFQTRNNIGENFRAYFFKNGLPFLDPGIISVTDNGYDIASYVMGLCELEKGDILDLRIAGQPSGDLLYWSGIGHTFFIVEAL